MKHNKIRNTKSGWRRHDFGNYIERRYVREAIKAKKARRWRELLETLAAIAIALRGDTELVDL